MFSADVEIHSSLAPHLFLPQIRVLEDMLRFEKQRGEAEEAAFKAQKKLLVAEVKKLRTTNVALKAECGDLRQQLKDLRQSVSQLGR